MIPVMETPDLSERPHREAGDRLVIARKVLGLSQTQIRQLCGVSKSNWSRFETGERLISPEYVWRLYEKTGFDPNFIYLGRLDGLPSALRNAVLRLADST